MRARCGGRAQIVNAASAGNCQMRSGDAGHEAAGVAGNKAFNL